MAMNPDPLALNAILSATSLLMEVHARAEERARALHERFNIFTTLLKADDEVRLHTRFLHMLLDPVGLHDCDEIFLNLFFETLAQRPGLNHNDEPTIWQAPPASKAWAVKKEVGRTDGHGQIDLLMLHPSFAIAIENKIHAKEQLSQLGGYGKFLKNRRGDAFHLLYLTKDGKKSASHDGVPYARISYVDHILPWLESCLRETYRIIPVNQALQQYREVVRRITDQPTESKNMKPIIDFVTLNPSVIRFRKDLVSAVDEAKALFLDQLAEGLMNELKLHYKVRLRDDLTKGRFGLDPHGDIFIEMQEDHLMKSAPFQICVEHDTDWESLLIGVFVEECKLPLGDGDALLIHQLQQQMAEYSTIHGYHQEEPTDSWPLGWHNLLEDLNDEGFAELMTKPIQPLVLEITEQILVYVKLLGVFYQKTVQA